MEYVVILIGNLFSGHPGSRRWECISALFGWIGVIALVLWLIVSVVGVFAVIPSWVNEVLVPTWSLCILQAVTRDGERSLKPFVDRWLDREVDS